MLQQLFLNKQKLKFSSYHMLSIYQSSEHLLEHRWSTTINKFSINNYAFPTGSVLITERVTDRAKQTIILITHNHKLYNFAKIGDSEVFRKFGILGMCSFCAFAQKQLR